MKLPSDHIEYLALLLSVLNLQVLLSEGEFLK
jgi:hypothetical protein